MKTTKEIEESKQNELYQGEHIENVKNNFFSDIFGSPNRNYQEFKDENKKKNDSESSEEGESPTRLKTTEDEVDEEEIYGMIVRKEKNIERKTNEINEIIKSIQNQNIGNSTEVIKEISILNNKLEKMGKELDQLKLEKQTLHKPEENSPDHVHQLIQLEGLSPNSKKSGLLERKILSGKRKVLMHKIEIQIIKVNSDIMKEKIKYLEKKQEKDSRETLECSAYFYTSVFLEYFFFYLIAAIVLSFLAVIVFSVMIIIFVIIQPILLIFGCGTFQQLKKNYIEGAKLFTKWLYALFQISIIVLFLTFISFPGALVVTTQAICIQMLADQQYYKNTEEDSTSMKALKTLLVIFFFFMSMKEVSSALNTIGYFYKISFEPVEGIRSLFPIRMLPQLFQIAMSFWFCYINLFLISQIDDAPNLIQNFAALVIVLEFDNYAMDFLRYMRFFNFYKQFIVFFGDPITDHERRIKLEEETRKKFEERNLKKIEALKESLDLLRRRNRTQNQLNVDEIMKVAKKNILLLKQRSTIPMDKPAIDHENDGLSCIEYINKLNEIFDKDISKDIINTLAKKEETEILLENSEFPLDDKYKLNEKEKMILTHINLIMVFCGLFTITMIYFEI